jgi:hypothetical protein
MLFTVGTSDPWNSRASAGCRHVCIAGVRFVQHSLAAPVVSTDPSGTISALKTRGCAFSLVPHHGDPDVYPLPAAN